MERVKVIEQMPIHETSPEFTDVIMQRISSQGSRKPATAASSPTVNYFTRRKQFIHFAVAGAATYLFITTGILQSLLAMDAFKLEYQMKTKVQHVVEAGIEIITHIIPF
ncbi:hypothetical protein ACFQZR_20570 [Paenibacillus sp. GCM10027629]|uniref:hypothetical protein n=1 Tax=Paenibacillus sp. GCM10027629 TaxID=3273414 RepID=UPI00362AA65E